MLKYILIILSINGLINQTTLTAECANIGLINLGNTCYMNAGLQCLFKTKILQEILASNFSSAEKIIATADSATFDQQNLPLYKNTITEFINLNNQLKQQAAVKNYTAIAPTNFHEALLNSSSELLRRNVQEDSSEFCTVLFNSLTHNQSKKTDKNANAIFFPYTINKELYPLFTGIYNSIQTCTICHTQSIKQDPFQFLNLEIPQTQQEIHLSSCFTKHTQPEELEYPIECETCRKKDPIIKTPGTKVLYFASLPSVLVVTLKRTVSFELRYPNGKPVFINYWGKIKKQTEEDKLTTPITIPSVLTIQKKWTTNNCPEREKSYNLYGIVMHSGWHSGGHYYAYAQDYTTNTWYEFNDSTVTQANPNLTRNSGVASVFYTLTESAHADNSITTEQENNELAYFSDTFTREIPYPTLTATQSSTDPHEILEQLALLYKLLEKLGEQLEQLEEELRLLYGITISLTPNEQPNTKVRQ